MADQKPTMRVQPLNQKPSSVQSEHKKNYLKDSASRIQSIAVQHSLDALLHNTTPEKSLLERALYRERKRKEQRQLNLETILKLAHYSCQDETAGEPEKDWLERYFDMAQEIHNPTMQKLWAQVLKREVINPGATSMKALKVLKEMTTKEAHTLQRAAALGCVFGGDQSRKLLMGYKSQAGLFNFGKRDNSASLNMSAFQLPYSGLLLLIELGLLHNTELESGEIDPQSPLLIDYQGKILSLQVNVRGVRLLYYRFTPTGNELCKLLGNKPNSEYYEQMLGLLNQKFTVQSEPGNQINDTV